MRYATSSAGSTVKVYARRLRSLRIEVVIEHVRPYAGRRRAHEGSLPVQVCKSASATQRFKLPLETDRVTRHTTCRLRGERLIVSSKPLPRHDSAADLSRPVLGPWPVSPRVLPWLSYSRVAATLALSNWREKRVDARRGAST